MFLMSGIKTADISRWKLEKLRSAFMMFAYCYDLMSVNMDGLRTGNLTNTQMMFFFCKNLVNVSANGMNVEKVYKMTAMFNNCPKLVHPEIESWNPVSLEDMSEMFAGCKSLDSGLDLSGWTIPENAVIEHQNPSSTLQHDLHAINKIVSNIKRYG